MIDIQYFSNYREYHRAKKEEWWKYTFKPTGILGKEQMGKSNEAITSMEFTRYKVCRFLWLITRIAAIRLIRQRQCVSTPQTLADPERGDSRVIKYKNAMADFVKLIRYIINASLIVYAVVSDRGIKI